MKLDSNSNNLHLTKLIANEKLTLIVYAQALFGILQTRTVLSADAVIPISYKSKFVKNTLSFHLKQKGEGRGGRGNP